MGPCICKKQKLSTANLSWKNVFKEYWYTELTKRVGEPTSENEGRNAQQNPIRVSKLQPNSQVSWLHNSCSWAFLNSPLSSMSDPQDWKLYGRTSELMPGLGHIASPQLPANGKWSHLPPSACYCGKQGLVKVSSGPNQIKVCLDARQIKICDHVIYSISCSISTISFSHYISENDNVL